MTASKKQSPASRRKDASLVTVNPIDRKIRIIRAQKVILSTDLATLYGVEPRVLVQAVKRNINRFPRDFMFQLTAAEARNLKSQFVISSWGGRRAAPFAFTEQGVAMLSSALRSERAVKANIAIMRAFVRLREMLATHEELRQRIEQMEKRYDTKFQIVFATIKEMLETPIRFEAINRISRPVRRTELLSWNAYACGYRCTISH